MENTSELFDNKVSKVLKSDFITIAKYFKNKRLLNDKSRLAFLTQCLITSREKHNMRDTMRFG